MTTSHDLVVRGGTVCSSVGLLPMDVIVDGGRISALSPPGSLTRASRSIDADGLVVLPGAIDAHVHFDDPGRSDWEGWETGSLAAAAGGVTTVIDMPIDSEPPTTTAERLREKERIASGKSLVDFALWGGLTDADPVRLAELVQAGAAGFKAFLCDSGWDDFPPVDDETLESACRFAASHGRIVGVHCENPSLFEQSGPIDRRRSVASEVDAVERVVAISVRTGARVHVVHCSAADAIDVARPVSTVTVETCPHYLVFSNADVAEIGVLAECAPPVRDEQNRMRLWQAVRDGSIATIGSDHSPCSPDLKFADPPFLGIDGVETALAALVSEGRCDITEISRLRTAAADIFGLARKGAIAPGRDADLALVDLGAVWTVGPATTHSRHRASPLVGRSLSSKVITTIVRGEVVYEDGAQAGPARGQFVRPKVARRSVRG